ncbi:hypothetical protein DENSPDRAFT_770764 [Dentipellis sp. KUC8613]|nr:hypothetical protein DENSPDRAFT_770764 [Dentipellis sp. KUC8613]
MASPDRTDLLRNAVAFLNDPKTQGSSLAQRVQFLEAKGLTPAEIEHALSSASMQNSSAPPFQAQPTYGPFLPSPLQPQRPDWRDYFITAVVSGTVAYATISLARKYLLPYLRPPTTTAYEDDRDALTAQFDAAEALLKEIQADTAAMKTSVQEQREKVDSVTAEVEAAVTEMRQGQAKARDEMREIREEINNVRDMLPKMIDRNKETQQQSLAELQQELKSLKALLLSRGSTVSSTPTPPLPNFPPRPTIPAWQLARPPSATATPAVDSIASPSPSVSLASVASPIVPNGKGKEVQVHDAADEESEPEFGLETPSTCSLPQVPYRCSQHKMFSQFRNVVEGLAQPQRRQSQDASAHPDQAVAAASPGHSSTDGHTLRESISSTSHLADSALASLRKSLAAQRSGSPVASSASNNVASHSPSPSIERASTPKLRLEDRLRASFAIGDTSGTPTPNLSSRSSPVPVPVTEHPLSPSAVPLPQSPPLSDAAESFSLLSPIPDAPPRPSTPPVATPSAEEPAEATSEAVTDDDNAKPGLETEGNPEPDVQDPPEAEKAGKPDVEEPAPLPMVDEKVEEKVDNKVADKVEEVPEQGQEDGRKDDAEAAKDIQVSQTAEEISQPVVDAPTVPVEDPPTALESPSPDAQGQPVPEAGAVEPEETSPTDVDAAEETILHLKEVTEADELTIETLRERLKLVEQRFSDVSTSFKRLQAEKLAADQVLKELTPVESLKDVAGLRDYLQNFSLKVEISQDEIKRLTGKLTRQDERIEELRETHRLESRSQSDLLDQVRKQLAESESLVTAGQGTNTKLKAEVAQQKAEIEKLHTEVDRAKSASKDEEEKRTKAVSLLKTVRQKLVKAEKERDEAVAEAKAVKASEKSEREKEQAERAKLQSEIDKVKGEKETAIANLKALHERESTALKERSEKELSALRGQFELEAITTKASHDQAVNALNGRIAGLESSVQALSAEKDGLFDQLQLRQAELESSRTHLEVLQSQNTELQYQLRESDDRLALITEELSDLRREHESKAQGPVTSAEEVARLLSAAETRYEAKIADLRRTVATLESEQSAIEAEWSRKLAEKNKETERMKSIVDSSMVTQQDKESTVHELRAEIDRLKEESHSYLAQISKLEARALQVTELEEQAKQREVEWNVKIAALEQQIEDAKSREAQARTHIKTLRDELRKVQSSAALLERQRNPGVGYWSSPRPEALSETQSPANSNSALPSRVASPRPSSPSAGGTDEEVNLEYLRNVILQFLEHKEMRPNLVRVLSIILHFTPQETRRLIAKV